ncbi:MAG: hypothetical protein PHR98_02250 [Candidatus Shapirobacteria bacterium]|jgi:LmbE family N-acetylglucosaminyl deacetylase|nr:hypothetical protein [Candidatus Shapirobacteria bacterium]
MTNQEAVVISPHIDDAVISLGSHLYQSYGRVDVLNVFNLSQETITGVEIPQVSSERKKEDKQVTVEFGFNFSYADLPDTSLRGVRWDDPTAPLNEELLNQQADWLLGQIRKFPTSSTVFIPASFGLHPDHYLTTCAFSDGLLQNELKQRQFFVYADLPYYFQPRFRRFQHNGHDLLVSDGHINKMEIDQELKQRMLSAYLSQLSQKRIDLLTVTHTKEYFWNVDQSFFIKSRTRHET